MPATVGLVTGHVVARSGAYLMARIRGANGQLIKKSSISTITYVVSNLTAGTTGSATSLTVASVVFNALQTPTLDPRWTKDATGYNFAFSINATDTSVSTLDSTLDDPVPERNRYRVDCVFTPTSGQAWRVPFEFLSLNVYA